MRRDSICRSAGETTAYSVYGVALASTSNALTSMRLRLHRFQLIFKGLHAAVRVLLIGIATFAVGTFVIATILLAVTIHFIYFDRTNLPDLEAFIRFDSATVGHIYDRNGIQLAEFSREHRRIVQYNEIPPIVRDAILAAEDKNFFSHGGVDYSRIPRVLQKVRVGTILTRITRVGRADKAESLVMLRQGGSTITQQLVRAYYLRTLTEKENGNQLRSGFLSYFVGARSAKKLARKLEEIRLSVWVEDEMAGRFGSKRRAKEEILARYASFLYMGNGQYGFSTASQYYFGRPLASLTAEDADKAALLAGIAKSPRYYAPDSVDSERVLHRRNQILRLMVGRKSLSDESAILAEKQPIRLAPASPVAAEARLINGSPAVIDAVFDELKLGYAGFNAEDLMQGRIQITATPDGRVQRIAADALEHGLASYGKRHPMGAATVQGSIVVLSNSDASVLAEVGGRRFFKGQVNDYSDFNRATQSARQPGSAMKPILYLSAFLNGPYTLESIVPDEPISIPAGNHGGRKNISNYDGQFKGSIPLRLALAESRNAVAMWITEQIGISSVLRTAREVGIESRLQPYPTTSLGASEVTLLELANAYRTIATGTLNRPHIIHQVSQGTTEIVAAMNENEVGPTFVNAAALDLVQEGLRGVVRLPTGTAHALTGVGFPIPIMGKTGTTSQFRDALFVGSTYGPNGITVAVRIGFDDNRSLGNKETGGLAALPVFREILLKVYQQKLVGAVPAFPEQMEKNIDLYLSSDFKVSKVAEPTAATDVLTPMKALIIPTQRCNEVVSGLPANPCPLADALHPIHRTRNQDGKTVFENE
jgi:penicillin-binding protein 1A